MKNKKNILLYLVLQIVNLYANAIIEKNNDNFYKDNVKRGKIILNIQSENDVKGIQFHIIYNQDELFINENSFISLRNGIKIYSKNINNGFSNVLVFGNRNNKIIDTINDNIVDFIEINFQPVNKFIGTSKIKLESIYIAGNEGQNISSIDELYFDVLYLAPHKTTISKNTPNPFSESTHIDYQLSESGFVNLIIYDSNGGLVKKLVEEYKDAGYYSIIWDATNNMGYILPNGRYLLKMDAPNYNESITMTLFK